MSKTKRSDQDDIESPSEDATTSRAKPGSHPVIVREKVVTTWPQLNSRVPPGLKATVVAEVGATGKSQNALTAEVWASYFLARAPRTEWAQELHNKHHTQWAQANTTGE